MDTKTILVVDDCASTRLIIRNVLDHHAIIEAENGLEAIEKIKQYNPSIILLDLHMPVLDGLGVLKFMQDNSIDTHVIVVTSFEDEGTLNDAFDGGADEIILKPIRPNLLKAQVFRAVKSIDYKQIMTIASDLEKLITKANDVLKGRRV